jgi:dTDP-4-dehydrorhamnose reductase
VTRDDGCYEAGVFDVSSGAPERTPLAEMVEALARGEDFRHRSLEQPGWWRRPSRLLSPRVDEGELVRATG